MLSKRRQCSKLQRGKVTDPDTIGRLILPRPLPVHFRSGGVVAGVERGQSRAEHGSVDFCRAALDHNAARSRGLLQDLTVLSSQDSISGSGVHTQMRWNHGRCGSWMVASWSLVLASTGTISCRWRAARRSATSGQPLATACVPSWIDVRDLALAHVEALLRPDAGGKRYIPGGPERFSYDRAASIMEDEFAWAKGKVAHQEQAVDDSYGFDSETTARELAIQYTSFQTTVVDLISQLKGMHEAMQESSPKARYRRGQ
ncbi:hypothetical protein Sste5346_006049 [Sporothrix stenoceras]|uniref:Uncharacterized protein n=1 Tax=Sporothrix stenoceras TaxID=5173 RepID=A0ABR3Z243_9PEZI